MSNKTFICATCKGEDIVRDASVEWSTHSQLWVLQDYFDDAFCYDCDKECKIEMIELVRMGGVEHEQ